MYSLSVPHVASCTSFIAALAVIMAAGSDRPATAAAGEVTVQYTFSAPEVTEVVLAGQRYDRLVMPGCANGGDVGQPSLPRCGARILLPFGTEADRIELVPGPKTAIGGGYLVEPVPAPVRLCDRTQSYVPPTPDPVIYGSNEPFPATRFEEVGTYGFRGFQILILKLHPVEYRPASGELYYHPDLTVKVHTRPARGVQTMFRGLMEDEIQVKGRVDNPEMARTYRANEARGERSYQLLILTTSDLVSAFEPLRDYHNAHGMPTEIHTTEEVGSTDPIDVRDYIRERYQNDGIEYVIIGGDDDVIPAMDLYVDSGWGPVEYHMPGDIFFSCLDGTWNSDNDSQWGEPTDGPGGSDVDLMAEVYVGRASVGDVTEAGRFVNKSIWYLEGQHSTPENVILVGEYLGFGGPGDWGGNYKEEFIDGSSNHGYTTVGFPTDTYNVVTLFERDGNWSDNDLLNYFEDGIHMLNHMGHGSETGAMKLDTGEIMNDVHNDDLFFVYSQTCLAGHLDGLDCWAEYMHIKIDEGAFAVIMNARYGWGEFDSTDGPSQRYDREFWDAVFSDAEGLPEVGKANADSKEDNIYRVNDRAMRWCHYELNLFGDPTLSFRQVTGMGVSPSHAFASEGPHGGPFTPDEMTYTVINREENPIEFQVTKTAEWFDLSTDGGTIPGGGEADVVVSINDVPNDYPNGHWEDLIEFVNLTSHEGDTTRLVTLDVGVPVPVIVFPLDNDPGWSTEGLWAFGQPTGGGGEYGGPDPTSGYTGPNVYGYNLNGDYENSMPERHLTSQAIDCSELTQVQLKFRRWLGVEQPSYDHAYVRVSTDGTNWSQLWTNDSEIADGAWQYVEYDISEVADNQPTVYLRWTMGTTDSSWRYCGWNIDDVEIWGVEPTPECPEDINGDGVVDTEDLLILLGNWGTDGDGDIDGNGVVNTEDLLALLAAWGECP
jgi:hypothetical protein